MDIRIIKKEEIVICHKVIVNSFIPVASSLFMTEENCSGNSAFLKLDQLHKMYDKGLIILGLYDDFLIGCIGLEKKSDDRYKIKLLSVIPGYRHRGLGAMLIKAMEERVIQSGGIKLQLGMIYENEVLRKWYESLGFKIDKVKTYKGNTFKIVYMSKDLK